MKSKEPGLGTRGSSLGSEPPRPVAIAIAIAKSRNLFKATNDPDTTDGIGIFAYEKGWLTC